MTTPILLLEEWQEAQAQPQVTVNEALRWLEAFAQLSVFSKSTTAPPPSPEDGALYIVPSAGASGDWADQGGNVALFLSTAWAFRRAPVGSIAYVQDEDAHVTFKLDSPVAWEPL